MADYFEEIEVQRALVTDLLEVTTCDNMRVGDLIVVDENIKSVRFATGSSGQVLITDSGTSTHLAWANVNDALSVALNGMEGDILYHNGTTFVTRSPGSSGQVLIYSSSNASPIWTDIGVALGFTASGQVITSGPNGSAIIEGPGTPGQVLTISSSGIARWQDPAAGNLLFSLNPGQVRPRPTKRCYAHFVWDDAKYGVGALNLNSGALSMYVKIEPDASATLEFEKICGPSTVATLTSPFTLNSATSGLVNSSGVVCLTGLTSPDDDGLYGLCVTLDATGTGPNALCGPIQIYGAQLKYISGM